MQTENFQKQEKSTLEHLYTNVTNRPVRDSSKMGGKYALTKELYPNDKHPPFCNGWLYLLGKGKKGID